MGTKKSFSNALDSVFAQYRRSLRKATKYASEIAQDEIEFKAKSCLYEYYDNFEPNIYKRTDTLVSAFVPYTDLKLTKAKMKVSVGMGYDSSKLENMYFGSEKWSPVQGAWVLDNYLNGIHPTTDGSYVNAEYIPIYDGISPTEKMEGFLKEYIKTFSENILVSFVRQATGQKGG